MREIKLKITYFDYSNVIVAKIINIDGWFELMTIFQKNAINDNGIIKIERVLDANSLNVIDTTEQV